MAAKKTPTPAPPPRTVIENCTFTAEAAACSEPAATAIAALAHASARHADALEQMALVLRGTQAHFGTGIHIGSNND